MRAWGGSFRGATLGRSGLDHGDALGGTSLLSGLGLVLSRCLARPGMVATGEGSGLQAAPGNSLSFLGANGHLDEESSRTAEPSSEHVWQDHGSHGRPLGLRTPSHPDVDSVFPEEELEEGRKE